MPAASETLAALEQRLASSAWTKPGPAAAPRSSAPRSVGNAKTLADAAVQLRRLVVEAEAEGPSLRGLLAEPDMRRLVASVLAVVEREADAPAALR